MKMRLRNIKEKLNNSGLVLADSILDGTYLAASMVTYTASCMTSDLQSARSLEQSFYATNDIPVALLEILLFSAYSIIASHYANKDQQKMHWLLLATVLSWPYFRDFISGMKNGRHAVVDAGFLIQHGAHHLIYSLTNPVGIVIGVLLAFNLVWYRRMNNNRNLAIQYNHILTKTITSYDEIKRHSTCQKSLNYISSGFDGLTDGMYLFGCLFLLIGLGVSTLSAGAPLIAAIIVISIITISSFISKMHNEYEAQKELTCSELQCEIALLEQQPKSTKQLTEKQLELQQLSNPIKTSDLSFIGKSMFFVGRATLSGAKNATAAIKSIQAFISNALTCMILGVVGIVCSVFYSIYLAIKTACRQLAKIPPAQPGTLFAQPSDQPEQRDEQHYLRNVFV